MTSSKMTWKDLKFWKTDHWKRVRRTLGTNKNYITPHPSLVFRPFIQTKLDEVKVVFLYPEPYFKEGIADGLALSASGEIDKIPVPLFFLFKELTKDVRVHPRRPDLSKWSRQGVLLWNAVPVTFKGHSGVQRGIGWEALTREIIETCYLNNPNTIFVFFGDDMKETYGPILPEDAKYMNLPLPYGIEFMGTKPFSAINATLKRSGAKPVNWSV